MTITVQMGLNKGAAYVGLLHDIGDGGVAAVFDGASFLRGTLVRLEVQGAPPIEAWVCHSTQMTEGCRVGLSFAPVRRDFAEGCWDPSVCRSAAGENCEPALPPAA